MTKQVDGPWFSRAGLGKRRWFWCVWLNFSALCEGKVAEHGYACSAEAAEQALCKSILMRPGATPNGRRMCIENWSLPAASQTRMQREPSRSSISIPTGLATTMDQTTADEFQSPRKRRSPSSCLIETVELVGWIG